MEENASITDRPECKPQNLKRENSPEVVIKEVVATCNRNKKKKKWNDRKEENGQLMTECLARRKRFNNTHHSPNDKIQNER